MDRLMTQEVNSKFAGSGSLPGTTKNLDCGPLRKGVDDHCTVLIFKVIISESCDRPTEDLNVPLTPGLRFSAMSVCHSVCLSFKHGVITTTEQHDVRQDAHSALYCCFLLIAAMPRCQYLVRR